MAFPPKPDFSRLIIDKLLRKHYPHFSISSAVCRKTPMLNHPRFKARNSIIEYYGDTLKENVKVVGPVPKFTNYPQTIWRGGPTRGADSDDILEEPGFNAAVIQSLRSTGSVQQLIQKDPKRCRHK